MVCELVIILALSRKYPILLADSAAVRVRVKCLCLRGCEKSSVKYSVDEENSRQTIRLKRRGKASFKRRIQGGSSWETCFFDEMGGGRTHP